MIWIMLFALPFLNVVNGRGEHWGMEKESSCAFEFHGQEYEGCCASVIGESPMSLDYFLYPSPEGNPDCEFPSHMYGKQHVLPPGAIHNAGSCEICERIGSPCCGENEHCLVLSNPIKGEFPRCIIVEPLTSSPTASPTELPTCENTFCPSFSTCSEKTLQGQAAEVTCTCNNGYLSNQGTATTEAEPLGSCTKCGVSFGDCPLEHPCSSSDSANQVTQDCDCIKGFNSASCDSIGQHKVSYNDEQKQLQVGSDECSTVTIDSISCTDTEERTALAIVCASTLDPQEAMQLFTKVINCFDQFQADLAGGRLSFSRLIGEVIDRTTELSIQATTNSDFAKLRVKVDTYSTLGYTQMVTQVIESDSPLLSQSVSSLLKSRIPIATRCLGTCPCAKEMVLDDQGDPYCESTAISAFHLITNSLRCASIPVDQLAEISLATPAMFAASAFHCLSDVVTENSQSTNMIDQEAVLKQLEKVLSMITDQAVATFKSSIPKLRQLVTQENTTPTHRFRVPPFNKGVYQQKLANYITKLEQLKTDLANKELRKLISFEFDALRDNLGEALGNSVRLLLKQHKQNTEAAKTEVELDIADISASLASTTSRIETANKERANGVTEARFAMSKVAQLSSELIELAHKDVIASQLKSIATQQNVVSEKRQALQGILNSMVENQFKVVQRRVKECTGWWVFYTCDINYEETLEVQDISALKAQAHQIRSELVVELTKLEQLIAIHDASVSGVDVNRFRNSMDQIHDSMQQLTCVQHRIASRSDVLVAQTDSMQEIVGDVFDDCDPSDETHVPPVWDVAYTRFKTLLEASGLCRFPANIKEHQTSRRLGESVQHAHIKEHQTSRRLGESLQQSLSQRSTVLSSTSLNKSMSRSLNGKSNSDHGINIAPFSATKDALRVVIDELLQPVVDGNLVRQATKDELELRRMYVEKLDQLNSHCAKALTGFRKLTSNGKYMHEQSILYEVQLLEQQRLGKISHIYNERLESMLDDSSSVNQLVVNVLGGPLATQNDTTHTPAFASLATNMMDEYLLQRHGLAMTEAATLRLSLLCAAAAYADPAAETLGVHCRPLPIVPATSKGVGKLINILNDAQSGIASKFADTTPIDEIVPSSYTVDSETLALEITMEIDVDQLVENEFADSFKFRLEGPAAERLSPFITASNVRLRKLGLVFTDADAQPLAAQFDESLNYDAVEMTINLEGTAVKNIGTTRYEYDMVPYKGISFGYNLPNSNGFCATPSDLIFGGTLCRGRSVLDISGGNQIALPTPYRTWNVKVTRGAALLKDAKRVFLVASVKGTAVDPDFISFTHPPLVQSFETTFNGADSEPSSDIVSSDWIIPVVGTTVGVCAAALAVIVVVRRKQQSKKNSDNRLSVVSSAAVDEAVTVNPLFDLAS